MKLSDIKYLIIFSTMLNFGCSQKVENRTLFIQAYGNSTFIRDVIKSIAPKINEIIKKELGIAPDNDFSFFDHKPYQRITLYCVKDVDEKNISLITSALETVKLEDKKISKVYATPKVEFFGDQHDELVLLINDPADELAALNKEIKFVMHGLNSKYEKKHGKELYDIKKSEKFSYLPHMGLGRIRMQLIQSNIKGPSKMEEIFERIRNQIKDLIIKILKEQKDLNIPITTFGIFKLPQRSYTWFGPEPMLIKF